MAKIFVTISKITCKIEKKTQLNNLNIQTSWKHSSLNTNISLNEYSYRNWRIFFGLFLSSGISDVIGLESCRETVPHFKVK